MSKKKYSRKIKCVSNKIKKNDKILHPIILLPYTNSKMDNFCATTSYYSKEKMNFSKPNSNDDIVYNKKELQKLMEIPINTLNLDVYLYYYEIFNLDDLSLSIEKFIDENKPENSCLRLIDCFIKIHWEGINKLNTKFYNIFKNINSKYWKKYNLSDDKLIKILKSVFDKLKKNPEKLDDFYFKFSSFLKENIKK